MLNTAQRYSIGLGDPCTSSRGEGVSGAGLELTGIVCRTVLKAVRIGREHGAQSA